MCGKALSALFLTLCLFWLTTLGASAHNVVVLRSEPENGAVLQQAPNQIAVMFDEELETKGSTLQVFTTEGQQVDVGDGGVDLTDPDHASMIVHLAGLANAAYVVRWHVVLEDDDASEGFWTFTVGAAAPSTAPAREPALNLRSLNGTMWVGAGVVALLLLVASGWLWRRRFVSITH